MVWYVTDNKVSHKDPKVVTHVMDLMKEQFGDLTVTRGNNRRFLAMNITINSKKNIKIEMKEQSLNIIDIFTLAEGYGINEIVMSPAQKHLREVVARDLVFSILLYKCCIGS